MPSLQYWFTGAALAAFIALLAAISTLGYGWYRAAVTGMESDRNKAEAVAQRQKTERVKEMLVKAMGSANDLLREQADKDDDRAENDAKAWGQKTYEVIAAAYGNAEAALFLDNAGYVLFNDGTVKGNIRNFFEGRIRRITDLLRRADTMTVRNEFNPAKFN